MQKNKIVSVWILKYVLSRDRVCQSFGKELTFWLWDRLDSPILCEDWEIIRDITILLLLFCLCHFVMWHKRVQSARGNFISILWFTFYIYISYFWVQIKRDSGKWCFHKKTCLCWLILEILLSLICVTLFRWLVITLNSIKLTCI